MATIGNKKNKRSFNIIVIAIFVPLLNKRYNTLLVEIVFYIFAYFCILGIFVLVQIIFLLKVTTFCLGDEIFNHE